MIEFIYGLSKKRSHEINKLKNKKESVFIKISSKSEYKYWLVVRLKAIEYKEDFFLLFIFLLLLPS